MTIFGGVCEYQGEEMSQSSKDFVKDEAQDTEMNMNDLMNQDTGVGQGLAELLTSVLG